MKLQTENDVWGNPISASFEWVITQHALCGKFTEHLPKPVLCNPTLELWSGYLMSETSLCENSLGWFGDGRMAPGQPTLARLLSAGKIVWEIDARELPYTAIDLPYKVNLVWRTN